MFRGESGARVPGADAVSAAYQVLDRYLEEGRQHASGRSAWYPGDNAWPSPNALAPNNWLAEIIRLLMQLSQLGPVLPRLSQLLAAAPPFHPAQRPDYPSGGQSPWDGPAWSEPADGDPSKEPESASGRYPSGGVLFGARHASASGDWREMGAGEVESSPNPTDDRKAENTRDSTSPAEEDPETESVQGFDPSKIDPFAQRGVETGNARVESFDRGSASLPTDGITAWLDKLDNAPPLARFGAPGRANVQVERLSRSDRADASNRFERAAGRGPAGFAGPSR